MRSQEKFNPCATTQEGTRGMGDLTSPMRVMVIALVVLGKEGALNLNLPGETGPGFQHACAKAVALHGEKERAGTAC